MGAEEYFAQPNAEIPVNDGDVEDIMGEGVDADSPGDRLAELKRKLTAPIPDAGPLLEEKSEQKVFAMLEKDVKRTARLRKNRAESAKHWEYVKAGCNYTTLEKSDDQSIWKQVFDLGVEGAPQPVPNKIADTCNKMRNQVLIDLPLPKPIASGDDDRARAAAETTKRFLRANATPDAMNDADLFSTILDTNMTKRSGFVFAWADPMGGGWRPKQIKAHPEAPDPRNPMMGPKVDPKTGQPVTFQQQDGQTVTIMERTTDPILRYVAEEDGGNGTITQRFTKNPAEAARQWMPKLKRKTLEPPQVITIPRTRDVFSADHITLVMWETLGEAKQRFQILNALSKSQLKTLCDWRPDHWEMYVPESMRPKKGGEDHETGELHDDLLIFWLHRFCRQLPDYLDGAEVAVSGANLGKGKGFILFRDTMRDDVELEDGTLVPVLRRPPVSQFKGLNDVHGGDPFGLEPISLFGGANDIYATLYMAILDVLYKGLNPNVYIPATSPVTREEYNRRDGTPIEILVPEDRPTQETPPQLPSHAIEVLDRVDHAINSLAGTNETSNGLDSPYAISGEAKKVAINQAKVGLKQYWHNTMNGCTYYWLICAELAQAKLTVPQQLQITGLNSAYKQRYFVGSDLVGITKIAVEPGSGTMMSGTEKAQWLSVLQDRGWITKEQAGELARAGMSDDLGLAQDPHEEYADRCIADWEEGAPNGWDEDYKNNVQIKQQYEATMQQAVASFTQQGLDPQSAQQAALQQVPPPQFKPLYTPFEPRPNDEDPFVAKILASKMSRFMSTTDYKKHGPAWRSIFDEAYKRNFYNAGGQTVKQQADAAAAAAGQDAQKGVGGSDEVTFQRFVQDITTKVIKLSETAIAKSIGGGGAGGAGDGQADAGAEAEAHTRELALEAHKNDAKLAHDARESMVDRAHQSAEAAHDRAHDMKKTALQHHAKAQNDAARMQAKPIPGPSGDAAEDVPPNATSAQRAPALSPA